jgi:hypothetical protein
MNIFASRGLLALALTGGTLLAAGPVLAQELQEGQSAVTQLAPNASAVTYFVDRPDGYHLFVTVRPDHDAGADALHQAPALQFSSRIVPGQTIDVSVPGASGPTDTVMEITRRADRVAVVTKRSVALTN